MEMEMETEMRITVMSIHGIICPLVKSSDTIYNLKTMIQDKLSIPQNYQKLFLGQIQLEDESTLDYCNIKWDSVLIVRYKDYLSVMTQAGKVITIEFNSFDTIHDVKRKIQVDQGIQPYRQKLFFEHRKLSDGFTLGDYCIHKRCTLHLVLKSPDWMKIFVRSVTGKTIALKVTSLCTPNMVKAMMEDKDGIPLVHQTLFFAEKRLLDEDTLGDYHIENGSTIDLWLSACSGLMPIFIKTDKGRTINLEVKDSDTIGDLKIKIEDEEGVSSDDMKLEYNGQQLKNKHTLAYYHIHKESTLHLFVIHRGLMEIFVKAFSGKTITLKVNSSETISYLKALIEDSIGIPTDQQLLLCNQNPLHDHDVLGNYYNQNVSAICLVPLSRGVIQILIRMPGKAITLKVKSADTIGNLKAKMQELESIPSDQQLKLFFKGKELHDCCKIADYNIHWNSILHLVPESKESMEIAIKSETGKTTFFVKVESSYTVGQVKAKIREEEGFPLNDRSLLFNGDLLEDSRTLADYCIMDESILRYSRRPLST